MKTLVVYYSRTDRTRFIAEKIAATLEATLEEVVDQKKRFGMTAFMKASMDAMMARETKITDPKERIDQYDLIVIGTPVWFTRPTPAIRTYLKQNNLTGKRVALFCTNEGNGAEKALEKMKELLPNSRLTETLIVSKVSDNKEEAEAKVSEWCGKLKIS